jgi:hypothetical protein
VVEISAGVEDGFGWLTGVIWEGLTRLEAMNPGGCCPAGHPGFYDGLGSEASAGLSMRGCRPRSFLRCLSTGMFRKGPFAHPWIEYDNIATDWTVQSLAYGSHMEVDLDPITVSIITGLAVNYFAGYTQPIVNDFFDKVFRLKPELESKLKAAQSSQQLQEVLSEATGVIEANAAEGDIKVDGGLLDAMRRIQFDHQHGTVTIGNSTILSAVVITGGIAGSTGTTVIGGNTHLKSAGTSIQVGKGASIKMNGGASIKQT